MIRVIQLRTDLRPHTSLKKRCRSRCRLGHLLQRILKPRCVLALTATATLATQRSILDVLGLPPDGVVREAPLRDNLRLKVVHTNGGTDNGEFRLRLLALLTAGDLRGATSVIVYVAFQAQVNEAAFGA